MRLIAIFVLLLLPTPLRADSNYTVEELQLMSMRELYERAVKFCLIDCTNVDTSAPEYGAFLRETDNIWRVARQKNKGTFPKWVTRQKQAMKEGNPDLCRSPEFK